MYGLNGAYQVLGICSFEEIATGSCMERFEEAVQRYDEILECDLVSGEADYRLRVSARDLADFDDIHRRCLAELPGVSAMHTSFVLRPIKPWRGYSLRQ